MACGEEKKEIKESGREGAGRLIKNGEEEKLVLYSKETLVSVGAENQGFRFLCDTPGCGKSFKRKSVHTQHIAKHSGIRNLKCEHCDLTFYSSNQKYKHKVSHHETHICSTCDKEFRSKTTLSIHTNKHHEGKKQTFSCEVCTSSFSHKSDLNKHMKTHTAPESFSCEVCGKLFNYKNSLRRHEKIHKNERLHSCDICDQNFIQKCDLQKHSLTHDSSKFECTVCNQAFARKDSLVRHARLHRPNLSCPVESCWDKFPSKHSLLAHLRTDHNRLEVEPVMTSLTFLDRPEEEEDPEIVDNPEPVMNMNIMAPPHTNSDILVDIETQALENAGIFVDKTCLFNLEDDLDSELSTGEALVNESVLQSIQRERELEEHKFVIAE